MNSRSIHIHILQELAQALYWSDCLLHLPSQLSYLHGLLGQLRIQQEEITH